MHLDMSVRKSPISSQTTQPLSRYEDCEFGGGTSRHVACGRASGSGMDGQTMAVCRDNGRQFVETMDGSFVETMVRHLCLCARNADNVNDGTSVKALRVSLRTTTSLITRAIQVVLQLYCALGLVF